MECKLQSFKLGYWKAKAANNDSVAQKWKDECKAIYKRIEKLKQA